MSREVDSSEVEFELVTARCDFDPNSGNLLERLIFNNRLLILLAIAAMSLFLAWQAAHLRVNASFERMIPQAHPWIQNYFANKADLAGLGNAVRIVVENTDGDIFDPVYLETLKDITDTLFLTAGVDRIWLKSLWMPIIRWTEATEEGFLGGPVMPEDYDGSSASLEALRQNVMRSGIVGNLVANNLKSSMLIVPLLDKIQDTGQPVDYAALSRTLEDEIRARQTGKIRIHIIGFAKIVGDLIEGLWIVMSFFGISALIAAFFVFLFTRCLRSTVLLVCASLLGVIWLLGLMHLFGYVLDPYSILVPFLIFAIGLSHGAQKMNGIMQDIGRGTHKYVAARYTFRRLFMAGLTALLTNVVGFAVLMLIDVPVIRDLALATSVGVGVLIITKLVMIPILFSYVGVSPSAAKHSLHEYQSEVRGHGLLGRMWSLFEGFTDKRRATIVLVVAAVIAGVSFAVSLHLKIGDLDRGAPELRPDSRYNLDVAFVNENFGRSNDEFAVIMKTPEGACQNFDSMIEMTRLSEALDDVPGVQTTVSIADKVSHAFSGNFEANPKWVSVPRITGERARAYYWAKVDNPELTNIACAATPVIAYLSDHKAETLTRVVEAVKSFAKEHDGPNQQFLLAAGNAGIEAATNDMIMKENTRMLIVLYSAVVLLCFVTFRSWRAVLVALIPLLITSMLCEALMVWLGIGVKVATLPVIALGVGVGVDYALYLLSIQLNLQRRGETLAAAYSHSLAFTGKVVGLVGLTMAAGVLTWAWSPIKFQADMGILLTFMFLWNMVGALIMIPSLSYYLLRPKVV